MGLGLELGFVARSAGLDLEGRRCLMRKPFFEVLDAIARVMLTWIEIVWSECCQERARPSRLGWAVLAFFCLKAQPLPGGAGEECECE